MGRGFWFVDAQLRGARMSAREIGPLEQLAIDTEPFSGLAQHYYVLWLRACDKIDRLEAEAKA